MEISNRRIFEILSLDKEFLNYYIDNFFNRLNNNRIKELFLKNNLEDIAKEHKSLFNRYNLWNLSPLEKESLLYINLVNLNNDLCYITLLSNLLKNYYPLVIIDYNDNYYNIIKNKDNLKFKLLLDHYIDKEMELVIKLYKDYYLFPDNISIEDIIKQKIKFI